MGNRLQSAIIEAATAAGVTYIDDNGNARDINFAIVDPAIFCLTDDEKRSFIARRLPFVLGESIRKGVPSVNYCEPGWHLDANDGNWYPPTRVRNIDVNFGGKPIGSIKVNPNAVEEAIIEQLGRLGPAPEFIKPLSWPRKNGTFCPSVGELVDAGVLAPAPGRASENRHEENMWVQQYGRATRPTLKFDRFVERLSIMLKLCKAVSRGTVDADPKTCTIVVRVPFHRIGAARRALPSVSASSGFVVRVLPLSLRQHLTLWKFDSPTEGKL